MQDHRPVTRAAAAALSRQQGSDADNSESSSQPLHGKRTQHSDSSKGTAGGSKKNRSALSDLTNRGQQLAARQTAVKVELHDRPTQPVAALTEEQLEELVWGKRPQERILFGDRNPFDQVKESGTAGATSQQIQQQASSRYAIDTTQLSVAAAAPAPAWIDIDAITSLLGCPDYVVSIFENFREAEKRHRPTPSYLESVQTDVTVSMRGILVDWLVEVCQEYRLVSDTLFLAVSYLDRYLSLVPVVRARLQLVGVTCLLVASKYEEIYAPQVDQFVYITDNTYTRKEVLAMEEHILDVLEFELTAPTAKTFLRRFIQAAMAGNGLPDARLEHFAAYLVELALCEYGSLHFLPSHIAAAAVLVAQYSLGLRIWSPTLEHYSRYTPADLQVPARMLHHLAVDAYQQDHPPASREKFSSSRYRGVSLLRPPETLPTWLFHWAAA